MILSKSRGVTTIFNMHYMHVLSKSETITKQKRLCYYLLKLKDTWSNNGRDIIVGIPAKNEGAMLIICREDTQKQRQHITAKLMLYTMKTTKSFCYIDQEKHIIKMAKVQNLKLL